MNVLIYELQSKLQDLLGKLQKIQGISIYFAFNDHEFKEVTTNIHPNIIFINHDAESSLMKLDFAKERNMSIYIVDESLPNLNITRYPHNKKISLNRIFKETN